MALPKKPKHNEQSFIAAARPKVERTAAWTGGAKALPIRMEKELYEALQEEARRRSPLSMNAIVNEALRAYLVGR